MAQKKPISDPIYLGPDFETGCRREQKNKLAEVVLKRVHKYSNGYSFGKFLRNMISNKPFDGIDIAIPADSIPNLLKALSSSYKYSKVAEVFDENRGATRRTYKIWNPRTGTKIDVNFWTGKEKWENVKIDADVNALIRRQDNSITTDSYVGDISKDEIIKKIKKGEYEIFLDSKEVRNDLTSWSRKRNSYRTYGKEGTMMEQWKQMAKQDVVDAGYRVAANQVTKGVKAGIVALMKDKGMDGGKVEAVREVLETPVGDAIIAVLMGYGLTYVPQLQEDQRAQKLAEEFRVQGMATAGNLVLDTAFQYLLPVVQEAMVNLPAVEEKMRVEGSVEEEETETEFNEEEEQEQKQATA